MPNVRFYREGASLDCKVGDNLLEVALRAEVSPYRSWHVWMNCKGKGKCGSCRVELADPESVSPAVRTAAESRHLDRRFSDAGTRLACQVAIAEDAVVCTQPTRGKKRMETRSFIPRSF